MYSTYIIILANFVTTRRHAGAFSAHYNEVCFSLQTLMNVLYIMVDVSTTAPTQLGPTTAPAMKDLSWQTTAMTVQVGTYTE